MEANTLSRLLAGQQSGMFLVPSSVDNEDSKDASPDSGSSEDHILDSEASTNNPSEDESE